MIRTTTLNGYERGRLVQAALAFYMIFNEWSKGEVPERIMKNHLDEFFRVIGNSPLQAFNMSADPFTMFNVARLLCFVDDGCTLPETPCD